MSFSLKNFLKNAAMDMGEISLLYMVVTVCWLGYGSSLVPPDKRLQELSGEAGPTSDASRGPEGIFLSYLFKTPLSRLLNCNIGDSRRSEIPRF